MGRTLSVAYGDSSPERGSPWQNRQVSSSFVNGRKKPAVKLQTLRPCQSLSLSGEVARRSRAGEGCFRDEPSQSPTATAPPRGGALGRTGRFRPHQSTARRSQPISGKLFASAKASPFRERWHGGAVTERVLPGRTLSVACGDSSPERGSPWQNRQVSSSPVNGRKNPTCKPINFSPLPKPLPFGRGGTAKPGRRGSFPVSMPLSVSAFQNRSRGKIGKSVCAAGTPPDFVPATSSFWSRVEPWSCLPRIESSGRFSGSLLACKREHFLSDFMFCQSYNCRKMCFREEPSQSPAATAPPRGGALGRTSKFHPHSSTAGRSQLVSL